MEVGMVFLSERRGGTTLWKIVPGELWRLGVVLVLDPLFSLVKW